MSNGYKIFWTNHALRELQSTFEYISENWTEKELNILASKIEKNLYLISINPSLFPQSEFQKHIRRAAVTKHNTLYYRINQDHIEIVSFFSNRREPGTRLKNPR
jgi:plasmid stabilization system protein ParE